MTHWEIGLPIGVLYSYHKKNSRALRHDYPLARILFGQ